MPTYLDCALAVWSPTIGDPTVLGWVTVALYFGSALLAFKVVQAAPFPTQSMRRERLFWIGLILVLSGLGINKQLDLQSFLTAIGRCMAKDQGWYADRRAYQELFILVLIGGALTVGLGLLMLLRGTWVRSAVPILGLSLVIGFVLVRAVGFHDMDALIGRRFLMLRLNGWLELTGPGLISLTALILLLKKHRKSD